MFKFQKKDIPSSEKIFWWEQIFDNSWFYAVEIFKTRMKCLDKIYIRYGDVVCISINLKTKTSVKLNDKKIKIKRFIAQAKK